MKNLKVFFALTLTVMFLMTSCGKENPINDLPIENAEFKNAISQSEMTPSSELYNNAELNIEKWINNLDHTNEIDSRAVCPVVNSLEIQHWSPGSCLVQLATKTRRDDGQKIRIVHYTPATGVVSDYTYNGINGDDCDLDGLNFSIPYNSLPSGNITTYVAIMDGWSLVTYDYIVWSNC